MVILPDRELEGRYFRDPFQIPKALRMVLQELFIKHIFHVCLKLYDDKLHPVTILTRCYTIQMKCITSNVNNYFVGCD